MGWLPPPLRELQQIGVRRATRHRDARILPTFGLLGDNATSTFCSITAASAFRRRR
jgi:hypothetical protein